MRENNSRHENQNDGNRKEFEVDEIGIFKPTMVFVDELTAGEVGFVAAAIKCSGLQGWRYYH